MLPGVNDVKNYNHLVAGVTATYKKTNGQSVSEEMFKDGNIPEALMRNILSLIKAFPVCLFFYLEKAGFTPIGKTMLD